MLRVSRDIDAAANHSLEAGGPVRAFDQDPSNFRAVDQNVVRPFESKVPARIRRNFGDRIGHGES